MFKNNKLNNQINSNKGLPTIEFGKKVAHKMIHENKSLIYAVLVVVSGNGTLLGNSASFDNLPPEEQLAIEVKLIKLFEKHGDLIVKILNLTDPIRQDNNTIDQLLADGDFKRLETL